MTKDKSRILIVDDDVQVLAALGVILEHAGYTVSAAQQAREGLRKAYVDHPDLVLLDVNMPDMDGYTVLDHLKMQTDIPIIMLTAKSLVADRVRGLDRGAVDYILKPFSNEELLARIRRSLREYRESRDVKNYRVVDADLSIDVTSQRLLVKGHEANLTPTEWRLLRALLEASGHIVSFHELLLAGWGDEKYRDERSIKVRISSIRKKIGDNASPSRYIHSVRKIGYRFEPRR